ncbi:hypothetical protein FRX94_10455 [Corynebacterium canis]|uniref:Uncharacterized protein n=3 Tax=Corynebacterium canis TaxID=679663 RepID=A0A5C5UA48_9CORY|nr:hypothetical protein [Corynebacterium canis]TWT22826.1 hypothetical protein FRX94_10455 [Corynebacterium canis]WJY76235.1 hypothetical protein CCANI_12145 [Corynebacterium canis]
MRLVASKAMRQTVTKDMRQVVTKVMKQVVTKVLRDDSPKTLRLVFLFFVGHPNEEIQDDRRSTAAHNLSTDPHDHAQAGLMEPPQRQLGQT